jgi:DNA-binding NarL/FixJ family response regulator
MLVGEPGIGKTATIEQLARLVTAHGGQLLIGHCYDDAGLGQAYAPFVEALESYIRRSDIETLGSELGHAVDDLARIMPSLRNRLDVQQLASGDSSGDRARLMRSVVELLRQLSAMRPFVLVLEDLHDADQASLDLLVHVARNLEDAHLLIVGTYRDLDVQAQHPLISAIADVRRGTHFLRIQLSGLTEGEVERLLASTSKKEIPRPFTELVFRRTDGNPLFVQEMLRFVVDQGLVERRDGALRRRTEESIAGRIPEQLREVVSERVSRLQSSTREALNIAAVIGREFRVDVLQRVAGCSDEELEAALEEALAASIIEEGSAATSPITYAFRHAFIRQTLHDDIIAPRRARLHVAVGKALEHVQPRRLDDLAPELSDHYAHSSDPADRARAVHYAEIAARRASQSLAHAQAVRFLERALHLQELADPENLARRCDLLLQLGDALAGAGDADRVSASVARDALSLAETLRDRRRAFGACRVALEALDMRGAMSAAARPDYLEWAERATANAEVGTAEDVHARLALAHAVSVRERMAEARSMQVQALELAQHCGDPEALYKAAFFILNGGGPRHWPERLSLAHQATRWSRDNVSSRGQSLVLWNSADLLLAYGDRGGAVELHAQLGDLADRTRGASAQLFVIQGEAVIAIIDGRHEAALAHLERFLRRSDELGSPIRGRQFWLQLALFPLGSLGRHQEWLAAFDEFTRLARGSVPNGLLAYKANCLAHLGRFEEARALVVSELEAAATGQGDPERAPMVTVLLLETAVLLEQTSAATALAQGLECIADVSVGDHFYTNVARHLGAVAALRGDRSAALRYFALALETADKIRFRPELALTHLQMAESLLSGGDASARADASHHLELAVAELRDMHMQPALERALHLASGPTAVAVLTSREREVATLLALGRSNREIAEALVISEQTVEVHVKHVLSKLGLRSRAQVAAWMGGVLSTAV